jgi:hypothetical protein
MLLQACCITVMTIPGGKIPALSRLETIRTSRRAWGYRIRSGTQTSIRAGYGVYDAPQLWVSNNANNVSPLQHAFSIWKTPIWDESRAIAFRLPVSGRIAPSTARWRPSWSTASG